MSIAVIRTLNRSGLIPDYPVPGGGLMGPIVVRVGVMEVVRVAAIVRVIRVCWTTGY